jgi:hypothetical protein
VGGYIIFTEAGWVGWGFTDSLIKRMQTLITLICTGIEGQ